MRGELAHAQLPLLEPMAIHQHQVLVPERKQATRVAWLVSAGGDVKHALPGRMAANS